MIRGQVYIPCIQSFGQVNSVHDHSDGTLEYRIDLENGRSVLCRDDQIAANVVKFIPTPFLTRRKS